ncbi:IS110 family transposase [Oryzobacter telluris]|uniref:IS110 family transposase n=1 Tax=Oryzobacter telluris TaxID=3149179 RepID=UPI00370DDE83
MFAGIDTHKDTLAVAVVDAAGRQRAGCEVPNTEQGFTVLAELFTRHRVTRVGVEGSGAFGRAVAVHLAVKWSHSADVAVVEVPTLMTSRERRGQVGKGKTDPVDALAIARVTAREEHLPPVRLTVGPAADLRALLDYREDLITERGAHIGRVHADLVGLRPGYQHLVPTLANRARVRKALALIAGDDSVRAGLVRRRLERVIAIDAEVAALTRDITSLVTSSGSSLPRMYGVGPIVAARFMAEIVDIARYPNRNAFAAANGTAPIPASSGRTVRHRYNPGGNRQLNRMLYTVAITQIRADTEGRAYYERKRAAGKTSREALRCLKRKLSDLVFATMRADAQAATVEPGMGAPDAKPARLTA